MEIKSFIILIVLFTAIVTTELSFGLVNEHTSKVKDLIGQDFSGIQRYIQDSNIPLNFIPIADRDLATVDANEIINFLKPYKENNTFLIKQRALKLELRLANLNLKNITLRQRIVDDIVDAQLEPNKTLNPHPYIWLMKFRTKDFGDKTKAKIFNALKDEPDKQIMKICGIADINEGLPLLKKMLIDEAAYAADPNQYIQWYFTIGWSARLARARMGVQEDIDKCIKLVESELRGKPPRLLNLFDDIGYIGRPEAINFLKTYVFSYETIGQVKPTVPGEPVASYVMGILVDCLENFPIQKREERGYKQEEIEQCRKWMSEQKEWKIIR